MKKLIILISFFIFLSGCSLNKEDNGINDDLIIETKEEKEEYVDLNPIRIALYQGKNQVYTRQDIFYSKFESLKDIGIFSIILDNQESISGNYKNLYKEYSLSYENFSNYKIGYNISFTLQDGTIFNENILKPKYFTEYTFSKYLYIWLYDDINTSGWHSHIEEEEYNQNTVMSSIKLMTTELGKEIMSPIRLTVFTCDEDDFDFNNNYRGVSKFTTLIERIE